MSKQVVIAADSTCDLGKELIERFGVRIVPLGVHLGEGEYVDGVNIDPDRIFAHYEKTGELPKTAAPNIAAFAELCEQHGRDGLVIFTISSEMSSTYNNARLAALAHGDVHVVDTRNLSTGGGLLVLAAAEMAARGMCAAEIAAACRALVPRVDASFVIDDLELLHKGGRCSALAALGANLLQLKPCISVKDGKMGVGKKYRGRFAAVLDKYVEDRLGDGSQVVRDHVFVTHAGCEPEIYEAVLARVRALLPDASVHLTRAGCTVSSHCGRNTLGVLFIRK